VTTEVLATAWVCVRDRRVLVVRPHYTDAFYLPGGKPEPGESFAEAAAREVSEEVGLTVDPAELTLFTEIVAEAHNRPPGTSVRLICFTGAEIAENPVAAAEIGELAWFTSADEGQCAPAIKLLLGELVTAGMID
jgi:8-oxo-dGTP pyrophosphatase MutT (NUDIX family)